MSYPCTGIGSWWTTVQIVRLKREIGGNRPLQDLFSEHLGSRAASSPVGQCQERNRTVVNRGERAVLDSASYEIGQSVQRVGTGPGGMVGRGRETLPGESRKPAGWSGGVADRGAGGSGTIVPSDVGAPAERAIRRNSSASAVTYRTTAAGTGWQMQAGTW